ncbi:MAG: Hpt domain-containing protein [Clostridia bacterium]|nr:Hpt domain-containing protein [Clostridia bacterium]
MLTIEKLREWGANVDEGVARCMGSEDFYLKLVGMVLEDKQLGSLAEALSANDLDCAFGIAHALKGVYGNLSLTPVYAPINEMTELLRARTQTDYSALIAEALKQRAALEALAE